MLSASPPRTPPLPPSSRPSTARRLLHAHTPLPLAHSPHDPQPSPLPLHQPLHHHPSPFPPRLPPRPSSILSLRALTPALTSLHPYANPSPRVSPMQPPPPSHSSTAPAASNAPYAQSSHHHLRFPPNPRGLLWSSAPVTWATKG
jgi:hypothetical protein